MTDFERLLLEIVINAGEKLIDAMVLNKTEYSYRDSWFLCVIAEEEIAKLIILPFANLAGNLADMQNRRSIIYKHPVKQKIFKTFGIQNRDNTDLEKIKQEILYISPVVSSSNQTRMITPEQAKDELIRAVKLFDQIANINFAVSDSVSEEFKEHLEKFVKNIFIPAVKDLSPSTAAAIQKFYSNPRPTMVEAYSMYPLLFAELVQNAIPDTYKDFFKEIEGKSITESIQILDTYL